MMPFDFDAKIADWRTQLLDTSRRNPLINFRSGKSGGIDLAHPTAEAVWARLVAEGAAFEFPWQRELLGLAPDAAGDAGLIDRARTSPRLRPHHALVAMADKPLGTRLGRLALQAAEAETEQGIITLYAAFAFLRWYEADASSEPTRSPLLLAPARLSREVVDAPWRLELEGGDVLRNDTLAERLRADFQIELPTLDPGDLEAGAPDTYLGRVRAVVRHQARWVVEATAAVGLFNFQKLAMWEDLARSADRIKSHPLCQAVAGDPGAAIPPPDGMPEPHELDEVVPPAAAVQVLDADSSQQAAIEAVKRGANLVLDGPPGTGKSQTISNLIAEGLGAGKTILFVSEKAAALAVVKRRLDEARLGDFCLELHSHRARKREVLDELRRCLELRPEQYADPGSKFARMAEVRARLNEYVRELHRPRPPLGQSAYQVYAELAALHHLAGRSQAVIDRPGERDETFVRRVTGLLARLPQCEGVFRDRQLHPWRGCQVRAVGAAVLDDVTFHLRRLAELLPAAAAVAGQLARLDLGPGQPTVPAWTRAADAAIAVGRTPVVSAAWFEGDPRARARAVVAAAAFAHQERDLRAGSDALDPGRLSSTTDPGSWSERAAALGRTPLRESAAESVSGRAERLAAARDILGPLAAGVVAAEETARALFGLIGVSLRLPHARKFRRMADGLSRLLRLGVVPKGWWDPVRRQELAGVAARCLESADAARKVRADLAARLSLAAFQPDLGPAVDAVLRKPYLSWFSGRWKGARTRLRAAYPSPPTDEQLLADARVLADFHRRERHLREAEVEYAADLVRDTAGRPDWQATADRLAEADGLAQSFGGIPAGLQEALAVAGRFDRGRAVALVNALATAETDLRRHWAAARSLLALDDGEEDRLPDQSLSDLARRVNDLLRTAEDEAAAAATLAGLLRPGYDVALAAAGDLLRAAAERMRLRAAVGRLLLPTGLAASPDDALGRDWERDRAAAAGLLEYLDARPAELPGPVRRALIDPEVHAKLRTAAAAAVAVVDQGLVESWQYVTTHVFVPGAEVSTGIVLDQAPLGDLAVWAADRVKDAPRLVEWVRYHEISRHLAELGLPSLIPEVWRGQVKIAEAADAFRARFGRLWLDAVGVGCPVLREFAGGDHDRLVAEFAELDRQSLLVARGQIRQAALGRAERPRLGAESPTGSELGILLREVNKKRNNLPLRKLFRALPTVLPRLKPCLMMSPLAVATYLEAPEVAFDLVIFDEASQVRPHDAISAVCRGRQLVVAGDPKQLPPTNFFDRREFAEEADEAEESLNDYESLLDVCCSLGIPRRRLRWHYRSKREGLIAFANHFVYDGDLVTFPSARDADRGTGVAFEFVKDGLFASRANVPEARQAAELVLDHFRRRPGESLGVIAFGVGHMMAIQAALEEARKANLDLEPLFKDGRDEPFFVKNLENVQGDERDAILLSVGYGPDASRRVAMRFGPLNAAGGHRRLNVAVTRARVRMTVVSSIRATDIDLSRTAADGVRLLRAYLDYAENGTQALRRAITEAAQYEYDSPFEREVADELRRKGLTVHPQVGCGGFRVDLGIVDPSVPGAYLLGVECDGATYHSSATARDRDRLRQSVLESMGWRLCRIWSTDWFQNRAAQTDRVLRALDAAQAAPPLPSTDADVPELEAADPGPVSVPEPAAGRFASIVEVPAEYIRQLVRDSLRHNGTTDEAGLVKDMARKLGFQRAGKRIKDTIAAAIDDLRRAGEIIAATNNGGFKLP